MAKVAPLRMKGPQLERGRELCAQIADEDNPSRFSELVDELLRELEKKKERLIGSGKAK